MSNGNSFGNGASIHLGSWHDPRIATMAWLFRRQIPRVP